MQRPRVDLDPIAQALDRLLEHPLTRLVDDVAPELVQGVRALRQNLPDVAADLQRQAVREITGEASDLARAVGRALKRQVRRSKRTKALPRRKGKP